MRTRWWLALLLGIVLFGSHVAGALAEGFEGGDPGRGEAHANPNSDKHEATR